MIILNVDGSRVEKEWGNFAVRWYLIAHFPHYSLIISIWLGTYSKLKTNIFLSDSHHSCQAIPFSRVYFSLNPVRFPIFLSGPHLLIYWQKNINVASIWEPDHLQSTLLNWDTESVLALNKKLKVNWKFQIFN